MINYQHENLVVADNQKNNLQLSLHCYRNQIYKQTQPQCL